MHGEIIENDTETIVWTENILSVFGAKTPFSNLSGLVGVDGALDYEQSLFPSFPSLVRQASEKN